MGTNKHSKTPSSATTSSVVTHAVGEAAAIGDNTLATGTVDSKIIDKGPITKVAGTVTTSATAQSGTDTLNYVDASTFVEIYGADHYKTKTKTVYTSSESEGQVTTTETSITKFHAISKDVGKSAKIPERPIVYDDADDTAGLYEGGLVNGNVAAVHIDAQAYGENSLVDAEVSALVIEDHLSTVSFSVISAVD